MSARIAGMTMVSIPHLCGQQKRPAKSSSSAQAATPDMILIGLLRRKDESENIFICPNPDVESEETFV